MRILLDTNFLYSALFHPSPRFDALIEFVFTKHDPWILDYVADELIRKTEEKRPESIEAVTEFLATIEVAKIEDKAQHERIVTIRDVKDQPILDAALRYGVDIILSGDKDFTSLEIDRPRIMTPRDFIDEYRQNHD